MRHLAYAQPGSILRSGDSGDETMDVKYGLEASDGTQLLIWFTNVPSERESWDQEVFHHGNRETGDLDFTLLVGTNNTLAEPQIDKAIIWIDHEYETTAIIISATFKEAISNVEAIELNFHGQHAIADNRSNGG